MKINHLKRIYHKLEVDCDHFRLVGKTTWVAISRKFGASSLVLAKSLKFKLEGRKGSKSVQEYSKALVQAQEFEEEYKEESDEEDEEKEER